MLIAEITIFFYINVLLLMYNAYVDKNLFIDFNENIRDGP